MSEETERGEAATGGDNEPQPRDPRDDGSGDETKGTEFVGGVGGEEQAKDAEKRAADDR